MKLTPFSKVFITLIVLAVLGYVTWTKYEDRIRCFASPEQCEATDAQTSAPPQKPKADDRELGKDDFAALGAAPRDPGREGVNAAQGEAIAGGRLDRPLKVAINTWAGHAPGIVANLGLGVSNPKSLYAKSHGTSVEFILIEDPAAKFAAFQAGEIDVMWDTVDSWAREASVLAENGKTKGKAIVMQDWSRGGDGVVSLSSITSIEGLAGKRVATTEFTPSHWLLLYLVSQSGLTSEQRAALEKNIVITQDAPAAAAMFKAGKVDAAVTWEPDLSGAVAARQDEAHILISTSAATNVIADTLVARQEIIDSAPATLAAFVAGWFDGIDAMKKDPQGTNQLIGNALKLDEETVSGMLSGLKLTPFADNAQFFGLTGAKAHFETLFDTAFKIWRKKGAVTRPVGGKEHMEVKFVAALASKYQGQKVEEKKLAARAPSPKDTPILNKTLTINFTPGSDEIMQGSFFTLDALGETMVSFGNTYLRIEGNTDATGGRAANVELSERRAGSVKKYLLENFQIPAERFQTLGHGPDKPIADNKTEAGRQLNRRTDIRVILATN